MQKTENTKCTNLPRSKREKDLTVRKKQHFLVSPCRIECIKTTEIQKTKKQNSYLEFDTIYRRKFL